MGFWGHVGTGESGVSVPVFGNAPQGGRLFRQIVHKWESTLQITDLLINYLHKKGTDAHVIHAWKAGSGNEEFLCSELVTR